MGGDEEIGAPAQSLAGEEKRHPFHPHGKPDTGETRAPQFFNESVVASAGSHRALGAKKARHQLKGCPCVIIQPPDHPGIDGIRGLRSIQMAAHRCKVVVTPQTEMVENRRGIRGRIAASGDLAVQRPKRISLNSPPAVITEPLQAAPKKIF